MKKSKIIVVLIVVALIAAFFVFDLGRYFSLDYFKSQQAAIDVYYQTHRFETIAAFLAIYITAIAVSLPGATVLTLAAGAIFGLLAGTIIVSFASASAPRSRFWCRVLYCATPCSASSPTK